MTSMASTAVSISGTGPTVPSDTLAPSGEYLPWSPYRVQYMTKWFPKLWRDEMLETPSLLDSLAPESIPEWWRIVTIE